MGKITKKSEETQAQKPQAVALTEEGRINNCINLAYNLAEKRLIEGTATSQEVTHFLKMGTMKERLEIENLRHDIELKKAKTEALESSKRIESLYTEAIEAMREYNGITKPVEEDGEEE